MEEAKKILLSVSGLAKQDSARAPCALVGEADTGAKHREQRTTSEADASRTTEIATKVGYDGGKLVKGHKRHILVDTLGLLLVVMVTAANLAKKRGAIQLFKEIRDKFPRLEKIFADGGYQGQEFYKGVQNDYNLNLEVVKRNQSKGFKVLPWRSIVERTFAWLLRYRRLMINYEALPETAEAFIYTAMVRILVRRLV